MQGLPRESRLSRALYGEIVDWSPDTYLLADVFDVLAGANWQRAGNSRARKPKAYPRPRLLNT